MLGTGKNKGVKCKKNDSSLLVPIPITFIETKLQGLEMAPWLRAQTSLSKDTGLDTSIHIVADSHL